MGAVQVASPIRVNISPQVKKMQAVHAEAVQGSRHHDYPLRAIFFFKAGTMLGFVVCPKAALLKGGRRVRRYISTSLTRFIFLGAND